MIVVEVLLVAAVLFAVAAVAAGRGDVLADEPRDAADGGLPAERPLSAEDLDHVRFPMVLRGYRMAEVDEALDRLAEELADRDARIAELEATIEPAEPADRTDPDEANPVPDPPCRRPGGSRQVPPGGEAGRPAHPATGDEAR